MQKFEIKPEYLCQVTIKEEWSMYRGRTDVTPEELIRIIKGEDRCSSISSDDHPEFKKLRDLLGKDGYIKIERGWWNGDRVLKPFILNGKVFKKDAQFPCGSAIKYTIEH
jgi:hypothetical protein